MSPTLDPMKTKFLLAALPDIPFDGWTEALMNRTAEKLKLPAAKVAQAFPAGVRDLAAYLFYWATDETLAKLKKKKMDKMRVRDRIRLGVQTRLEILAPYKPAVSSAIAYLTIPPRSLMMPKLVWHTADKIWWAAGDTATDYNHYTKRLLLSGVLTTTTFYWLNDTSKNHQKTWDFLDRRIEDVMKIGQKISRFKKPKEA